MGQIKIQVQRPPLDDIPFHLIADYCLDCGRNYMPNEACFVIPGRAAGKPGVLVCANCSRMGRASKIMTIYRPCEDGSHNDGPYPPKVVGAVRGKGFIRMLIKGDGMVPESADGLPIVHDSRGPVGEVWVDLSEIERPSI